MAVEFEDTNRKVIINQRDQNKVIVQDNINKVEIPSAIINESKTYPSLPRLSIEAQVPAMTLPGLLPAMQVVA